MKLMVCKNCLRVHLVDEKSNSYSCKCRFPDVKNVEEYIESIKYHPFFSQFKTEFVVNHELYKFAFECAKEPYKEDYSEKIKKAVAKTTVYLEQELQKLLESNDELFIKFCKYYDRFERNNRHKMFY